MDSKNWTQATRLGSEYIYLLSHLIGPNYYFMLDITGNLKLADLNNAAEFFPMGFSTEQAL